jgi:hypothetical protein
MSRSLAWIVIAALALTPALSAATVGQPARASDQQQTLEAVAFASDFALSVLNAYSAANEGSYLLGSAGLAIGAGSAIWAGAQDVRTGMGRAVMVTGTLASIAGTFAILRAVQLRDTQPEAQTLSRSVVPHVGVGKVGKGAGVVLRWRW